MRFKRRKDASKKRRIIKYLALGFSLVLVVLLGKRIVSCFRRPAHNHSGEHRIAIIIPFISSSASTLLPPYFSIFLQTIGGSAPIIDFLIFHNGQLSESIDEKESTIQGFEYPQNVKFISLGSTEKFATYFVQIVDRRLKGRQEEQDKLVKILSGVMEQSPYFMVEFKPAFGYIFREFIKEYSHWGYSDFDIAFGDLPRWITKEELNDWDIVTYSYGDQERVYLRGQFTFHRNNENINNIWRKCTHLSEMDLRYENILAGEEKLQLVSAEGCYSNAVITTKNISVKYAVKALSDVRDHNKNSFEYGLAISIGKKGNRSVIYKAGEGREAGERFLKLSYSWFEKDKYYSTNDLQWEVGVKQKLNQSKDAPGCMYWMKHEYQTDICYKGITSSDTVMLVDGQLYKQRFQEQDFPHGITSRSFFHFQEWKRSFRTDQLLAFSRRTVDNGNQLGWQLFEEGAAVLSTGSKSFPKLKIPGKKVSVEANAYVPTTFFCLSSTGKKSHSSSECDHAVSWRSSNVSTKISKDWGVISEQDVTLVLTLDLHSHDMSNPDNNQVLLKILEANIKAWHTSPVVILVRVSGPKEVASFASNRLDELIASRSKYLVGLIHDDEIGNHMEGPSLNSMLNMAEATVRTRWVISGMEVNRGLVLSTEALLFSRRMIYANKGSPNGVYILGQMIFESNKALEKKNQNDLFSSLSMADVVNNIHNLTQVNKYKIVSERSKENELEKQINRIWMDMSLAEVFQSQDDIQYLDSNEISIHASAVADIQTRLASILADANPASLLHFSSHPLLLIDTKGAAGAISEISDLPEQCVNAFRLAQFAAMDYTILMLSGAFAASKQEFGAVNKESRSCDVKVEAERSIKITRDQTVLTYKQIAMDQLA